MRSYPPAPHSLSLLLLLLFGKNVSRSRKGVQKRFSFPADEGGLPCLDTIWIGSPSNRAGYLTGIKRP